MLGWFTLVTGWNFSYWSNLLFRFDPMVTLLMIGEFCCGKERPAADIVSWATAMKVFPIIFWLIWLMGKNNGSHDLFC
jgi:hypothetical protein